MDRYRLFVYGTLRKTDSRSFLLSDLEETGDTKFIRDAKTADKYKLVSLGPFPALLENGTQQVIGELWDIDERTKRHLDVIEGVPTLYIDKEIELEDGSTAIAYVQDWDKGYPEIVSGDWFDREV